MMLTFRPYKAGHLLTLVPQESQREDYAIMVREGYAEAMERGMAMSAWDGHVCVAAAGLLPLTPHRAAAWAVLSSSAAPCMLGIIRKLRYVLDRVPYARVDMTVKDGFTGGHRLARALGMKLETPEPMRAYGANGEDEYMYSRVKSWAR